MRYKIPANNSMSISYNVIHIDHLNGARPAGKAGGAMRARTRELRVEDRGSSGGFHHDRNPALCLAIIGFALVAIIAALPRGLDVEKKNREDTIVGQDATKWMDEIRNGEQGDDDLTNYVIAITNFWTTFNGPIPPLQTGPTTANPPGTDWAHHDWFK